MKVSSYLEIVCALILIVAILIAFKGLPTTCTACISTMASIFRFHEEKLRSRLAGVELLKMFCRHDIDSIVEVLLFSVARQMVIDHLAIKEALIGCVAVAILFRPQVSSSYPFWIIRMSRKEKLEKTSTSKNGSRTRSQPTKRRLAQPLYGNAQNPST